jgi:hypothetical protein
VLVFMVRKLHEDFGEPKMKNGEGRRNGHNEVDKDMSNVQVPPSNTGKKKLHRSTTETYFAGSHDEKKI